MEVHVRIVCACLVCIVFCQLSESASRVEVVRSGKRATAIVENSMQGRGGKSYEIVAYAGEQELTRSAGTLAVEKANSSNKGLVLWQRMESANDVEKGTIGLPGKVVGQVSFKTGRRGNGIVCDKGGVQFDPVKMRGYDVPATYEMWIKTPTNLREQGDRILLWTVQAYPSISALVLQLKQDRLCLCMANKPYQTLLPDTPISDALNPDTWYHIALAWDFRNPIENQDSVRFYVNGEVKFRTLIKNERTYPFGPSTIDGPPHLNLMLGCNGAMGQLCAFFDGIIDEFKVWDHAIPAFPRINQDGGNK